jgi:hypothetical protein
LAEPLASVIRHYCNADRSCVHLSITDGTVHLLVRMQELGSLKTDFESFNGRMRKVESRMLNECSDAGEGSYAISHIFKAQEGRLC